MQAIMAEMGKISAALKAANLKPNYAGVERLEHQMTILAYQYKTLKEGGPK